MQYLDSGVAPFTAMFRRDPVLPIYLDTITGERRSNDRRVNRVMSVKKAAEEIFLINIAKSQIRQKKNYDKRHIDKSSEIAESSLVLLKNNQNNHRIGGKLESKYIGLYEAVSLQGKGRAKLKYNLSKGK